ncbi:MAG: DinB family protein [Bacteroidetes bacterium]|nr:DinB family protein [Bacteroidota bacterium]
MIWALEITIKNREILRSFLDDFSLEQLNKIPKGFANNIIWNIAHTITIQQLLVYKLSGLPTIISEEMIGMYQKGTKPKRDVTQNEVDEIKKLLFTTIEKTKEDYKNDAFKTFNQYTLSTKTIITNAEEAMGFIPFHEGIHLGYILALKKSI